MTKEPVYRMSGAGTCPRALSAERLGYIPEPAPKWLGKTAEEGKWHEERIRNELILGGCDVYDDQLEVVLEFPLFALVGHIDGKTRDAGNHRLNNRLLEIKSMSQFRFDKWKREGFAGFLGYADQLSCYMEATGLKECLYIVKNRSSGYVDRRIISYTEPVIAPFSLASRLPLIVDKLEKVEYAVSQGILSPADFGVNSLECGWCGFKYLCVPEPKELTEIQETVLNSAARDWRRGKLLTEEGQCLLDSSKELFEQHTRATGVNRWRWDELSINLVCVREGLSYPKKKLLEVFTIEELVPASEVKSSYEYVRIADLRREEKEE